MAVKYICDWCEKEVVLKDLKTVRIFNQDDSLSAPPQEICVFCKEKLLGAIAGIITNLKKEE